MTLTSTEQLQAAANSLRELTRSAFSGQCADSFEDVERHLGRLETFAREMQQSLWAKQAETAIGRLERGEPLTSDDQTVIRTFLVSDAEQYVRQENNLQDWRNEMDRLMNDIANRVGTLSRESVGALRGVLKDAQRLIPDIRNYFDEKQRIERFDAAMQALDKDSRSMIARLMKEQLYTSGR